MSIKRLTSKNFPPSKGEKAIPVFAEYYNDLYDGAYRMNARDHHSMGQTYVIKHPLMAVSVWDYSVNGGATGTVDLNGGTAVIPDNAIIHNVIYDVVTKVLCTGATATLLIKVPTDGTLATIAVPTGTSGKGVDAYLGTPVEATYTTWVKTTAARAIQAEVTGAGTLTQGKIYCFIEYYVSELDESTLDF